MGLSAGKKKSFLLIIAAFVFFTFSSRASAQCVFDYLSDIPLDTQEQAGPALIMFLLDDSGSMDWAIMMDEEHGDSSGLYNGYGYVFDEPGIYSYSWPPLPDSRKMEWVTQWYETNKMYYDPTVEYEPWPRWNELDVTDSPGWTDPISGNNYYDMDPDDPRINPVSSYYTLDMNATYYDFGQSISTTDILDSGGVIVDNSDVVEEGNYIIIDDGDLGYSLQDANGAIERNDTINRSDSGSYNGDYDRVYDYEGTLPFTAGYSFNLENAGTYRVYIRWREYSERSNSVDIRINGTTVDSVNQENSPRNEAGQDYYMADKYWYYVGEYSFDAGPDGALVEFYHDGGNDSFSSDAVLLDPQFEVDVPPVIFEAGSGWSSGSNGEEYGEDYLYTNGGSQTYTATWIANNLDSSDTYTVYARWTGGGDSRLTDVEYEIFNDGTEIASNAVNQRQNHGTWVQLADDLNFSSGRGVVRIDRYTGNSGMCADAVAFVPSAGPSPLNLVRAHYYVQDNDGTMYLVNLDGAIEYWRVNDANDNMEIDSVDELEFVGASDEGTLGSVPSEIVTGRSYNEERVNFANWFSFYRKRELAAKAAVGNVINDIQSVYIGILTINDQLAQHALPVTVTLDNTTYDESDELLGLLYSLDSSGGTPLRTGLKKIGEYYSGNSGDLRTSANNDTSAYIANYTSETSYPYFTEDKGGACQHSFAIAMTDGYWNGGSPYVGNQDANTSNEFDGGVYSDSYSDTLADVAMRYYKEDLNSDLSNLVPVGTVDEATHQHMVTYSVSFGVSGNIDRNSYPECGTGGDCPTWPSITSGTESTLDDLYHAAVNGRGDYINAANPEKLIDGMEQVIDEIQSRLGSAASLATNSFQRTVGTYLYQSTYHTDNWYGDVIRMQIDYDTGEILPTQGRWSAGDQLDEMDWENRQIITYNGTTGVPFQYGQFTFTGFSGDEEEEESLIDYLRGDDSNNVSNGGTYRVRTSRLGDVVHSAPVYHRGVIYVGANDGMLHAFDADTGDELFAYVPKVVVDMGLLPELASTSYSHKFYVDNTPYVTNAGGTTLLVGGLQKGGKGYFCLDVSDPSTVAEGTASDLVQWEYNADGDDDLGYSYSPAYIVRTQEDGWVVIFGNGYDSVNEEAVLYVLNAFTGEVIKKFHTGVSGCNGLSAPAIIDATSNGRVDYVYAGDLKGNLWKFDLTGGSAGWDFAYDNGSDPMPLITVNNEGGGQPITSQPTIIRMGCEGGQRGYLVFFGTGQYLGTSDFEDTNTQTFYGVWDWQENWPENERAGKYLGQFTATADDPVLSHPPAGANNLTLLEQAITNDDTEGGWRESSSYEINYFTPPDGSDGTDTEHAGWFFNLNDERARTIHSPDVRAGTGNDFGIVTFISFIPSESPCDAGGYSWLYQFSACGGGRSEDGQFDTDGDGDIDEDDGNKSGERFDNPLYPPNFIPGPPGSGEDDSDDGDGGDGDDGGDGGDDDGDDGGGGTGRMYKPDATGQIHVQAYDEKPVGIHYWRLLK
jgi:Tfp pilus tip-associated adhesin PilY1